jgi:hypothetical protein
VGVERAEAEAILDGDRETAVALLMRVGALVEANRRLEARVAELERRLNHLIPSAGAPTLRAELRHAARLNAGPVRGIRTRAVRASLFHAA